jgi:hypothetical protein
LWWSQIFLVAVQWLTVTFVVIEPWISLAENATSPPRIITSAWFLDSLGVNVHINYTDTAYANVRAVAADLKYLGIIQVRSALPKFNSSGGGVAGSAPIGAYRFLAGQGVRFDFIADDPNNLRQAVSTLHDLASYAAGSITAVEGFNEINNFHVTYKGMTGAEAALAAQREFYAAVRADRTLDGIPVFDMTGAPPTASLVGRADVANGHPYTHNALQPGPFIDNGFGGYLGAARAAPRVITEFGNFSLPPGWPADKPYWEGYTMLGVDEPTQAKIVLNSLLEAMRHGVMRGYLYELYDEKADPAGKQPEFHYGLFRFDRTPKPAAMAIRTLTRLVATECAGSTAVRSGPPSFRLDDGGAGVRQVIVADMHGSGCVILWNNKEFWTWDQFHSHAIRPAPVTVRISMLDPATSYQVIDPRAAPEVVGEGRHLSVLTLNVPESPIVVVLKKD